MLTKLLCKLLPYKEIGWKEIGETFYRWTLVSTPWFKIVLHKLDSPVFHSECHDHPWDFAAFLLTGGYWEMLDKSQKIGLTGKEIAPNIYWRPAGSYLYRPAETKHNVATRVGHPNWSIVIMSKKRREWGMMTCN